YAHGVEGANVGGEMRALMQLLRYGRDRDGKPFVENPDNPAGEAIYRPYSRFKIVPMPAQPYRFPAKAGLDKLTPEFVGPVHENPYDQYRKARDVWPDECSAMKH